MKETQSCNCILKERRKRVLALASFASGIHVLLFDSLCFVILSYNVAAKTCIWFFWLLKKKHVSGSEKRKKKWATKSQKGKIYKFVCKRVKDSSNVEQFNENLNVDNLINDNEDALVASNVDVGIDDHFIPSLNIYIYDPRNWGILHAKTIYILIKKGYIKELNITFSNIIKTRVKICFWFL